MRISYLIAFLTTVTGLSNPKLTFYPKTITETAIYSISFTIDTGFPGNSVMNFSFPSEVTILDSSSVACTVDSKIYNPYSSEISCYVINRVFTVQGIFGTTSDEIQPSSSPITVSFPGVINPSSTKKTVDSIDLKIYSSPFVIHESLSSIEDLKIAASVAYFDTSRISPSSPVVGSSTIWTFEISTSFTIPAGSYISVSFPYWNEYIGANSSNDLLHYIRMLNPNSESLLNIDSPLSSTYSSSLRILEIRNGFTSEKKGNISWSISPIYNPPTSHPIKEFIITIHESSGYSLLSTELALIVQATDANIIDIKSGAFLFDNNTVGTNTSGFFSFYLTNPAYASVILEITIPQEIVILPSAILTGVNSVKTSNLEFTISSNVITIKNGWISYSYKNPVIIKISSIITPSSTAPTGHFIVTTNSSDGFIIDTGIGGSTQANVGEIFQYFSKPFVSAINMTIGSSTIYIFDMWISHPIPKDGVIIIIFPSEISVKNRPLSTFCTSIISGLDSAAKCQVSSGNLTIIGGFTQYFAGGRVSFTLDGVQNPSSTKITSSFMFHTLRNLGDSYLIDSKTSGITFKAEPADLVRATITPNCLIADEIIELKFFIVTSNIIPINGNIRVKFPSQVELKKISLATSLCSSLQGFNSSIVCSFSSGYLTIDWLSSTLFLPGTLEWIIRYVNASYSTIASSNFTLATYDSFGNMIDMKSIRIDENCKFCSLDRRWIQNSDIINITIIEELVSICFNGSLEIDEKSLINISKFLTLSENQYNQNNCINFLLIKDIYEDFGFSDYFEINIFNSSALNIEYGYKKENQLLILEVNYPQGKPKPKANLIVSEENMPKSYYTCQDIKEIVFDASNSYSKYQKTLNYSWYITVNSKNRIYYSGRNLSFVSIEVQDIELLEAKLLITTDFNTYDTIEIAKSYEKKQLVVIMGNNFTCTPLTYCQIFIDSILECGKIKSLNFTWDIGNAQKLVNSKNSSYLINKNTLEPGKYPSNLIINYGFGKLISNFTVNMIQPPLEISFNRSPGNISSNEDLYIEVFESAKFNKNYLNKRYLSNSSFHPRRLYSNNTIMNFSWECMFFSGVADQNHYDICPNKEKINHRKLNISKENLKNYDKISIKLRVESNNVSKYYFFNASISKEKVSTVKIYEYTSENQPRKLSFMKSTTLIAKSDQPTEEYELKWMLQDSILSLTNFIELLPDRQGLNEGKTYQIAFNLGKSLVFYYEFEVNIVPRFGGCRISPSIGKELTDTFFFNAEESEDDDLPLSYYFAYGIESRKILLRKGYSDSYSATLAKLDIEELFGFCRVYDALDDFNEKNQSIFIQQIENVQEIVNKILDSIEPATNIPVAIINVLTATLVRDNKNIQKDINFYNDVYHKSAFYINSFVDNSIPDDFFINQTLGLLESLTLNQEITRNSSNNIDVGLNSTKNFLSKLDEIGLDGDQAGICFSIVESINEINDQIIIVETEKLLNFTNLIKNINNLAMMRVKRGSSLKIITNSVDTFIKVVQENQKTNFYSDLAEFIYIPDDIFLDDAYYKNIRMIHSIIKLKDTENSQNNLVSLSFYNETGEISVELSKREIVIEIPLNPKSKGKKSGQCYYFEEESNEWSRKGCQKNLNYKDFQNSNESIICLCNHLTTFGFLDLDYSLSLNHGVEEFTIETLRLPGFIFTIILLLFYIFTLIRAQYSQHDPCNIKITPREDHKNENPNIKKDSNISLASFRPENSTIINEPSIINEPDIIDEADVMDEPSIIMDQVSKSLDLQTSENIDYQIKILESKSNFDKSIIKNLENNEYQSKFNQSCDEEKNKCSITKNCETLNESSEVRFSQQVFDSNLDKNCLTSSKKLFLKFLKLYINSCEFYQIIILNQSVNNRYFTRTKMFFIMFLSILLDALFFNYNYRARKVIEFENMLENELISFNIFAILFTSSVMIVAKAVIYGFQYMFEKRIIKIRLAALSLIFVLTYLYILYKVSCISTAFGMKISIIWVSCCLFNIFIEAFIFQPITTLFLNKILKFLMKCLIFLTCWKRSRCSKCKKCEVCKLFSECDICKVCKDCNQDVKPN